MAKIAVTIRVDDDIIKRIDAVKKAAAGDNMILSQTAVFENGARKELDELEKKFGVKK